MSQPRASLPVIEQVPARLGNDERSQIARIARRVLANDPALRADLMAPGVGRGCAGPALLVEDRSEIGLVAGRPVPSTAYRSLLLAQEGDLVVVDTERDLEFEAYCRDRLRLGPVEVLGARCEDDSGSCAPLCHQLMEDAKLFERLIAWARARREITVLPYIGTANVWMLAAALADRSGARVHVAAPMPTLARRANDKLWFSQRIAEVLGSDAMPPSHAVLGPEALVRGVAALARRHEAIVVKVPDSAGAKGNIRLEAQELSGLSEAALRDRLLRELATRGWKQDYPLFLSVWEAQVLHSPSVQLWIPDKGVDPVIEGTFAQATADECGRFSGAAPLTLAEPWQARIAKEALRLAFLFHELGYFGRCSLDAVLVGPSLDQASLHWIECNGRWGGVSIPLTLANRLARNWRERPFVVVQDADRPVPARRFGEVLSRLEGNLYLPGARERGVVLLTPNLFAQGCGLHFMALGRSVVEARADAHAASALLANGAS